MKKIIVLGAGLIGKAMAIDLCRDYEVACADVQMCSLEELSPRYPITALPCDFKNREALAHCVAPYDLVILAVPGHMGFETLKFIIEQGKNVVDISYFPQDPFLLDELAREKGVTAVVDCGVAPGMCNILAGYHHKKNPLLKYECLVGGLPISPEPPFNYKAVFSPIDVIEEYTRPARYRENGNTVVEEALTGIEPMVLDQAGELEAFNTDGLRTLAYTMPGVLNMKEKTLRFKGHAGLMKIFRETGLFGKNKIAIGGQKIAPLELTSKLLFDKWKLAPGEKDFTIMRVTLEAATKEYIYNLYDVYDPVSQTTSMARTTGYTCTAIARLVAEELFTRKGICPPEYVGEEKICFDSVMQYLSERNIQYKKKVRFKKAVETI